MIKHYVFSTNSERGRVAVSLDNEEFRFAPVSGPAPRAWVLGAVIAADESLVETANAAALRRRHDYAAAVHHGMSGSRDFRLIERRNDDLADYPTAARIHVSMYGKLNAGVKCWVGDLPPLVAAMMDDDPTLFAVPDDGAIKEVPTRKGLDWKRPATELLAILDEGGIAYDRTEGVGTITADMPLWLSPAVLERLADLDGGDFTDWQPVE